MSLSKETAQTSYTKSVTWCQGLLALSPLAFFCVFYLVSGILAGDFYATPITVAFMLTCIYAVATTRRGNMEQRISLLSKGAGQSSIMLMIWIFILAGAFAASAKQLGAIDATVNLAMNLLPGNMLLAGVFLAACFISLSMGTSVGTIAALVPIAHGIAGQANVSLPLMVGIVVGGAYFGDNLSFISDTTIMATRTQGCRMRDKFLVNFKIVVPAAIITLIAYVWLGWDLQVPSAERPVNVWLVLPYLTVLVTALLGINVMIVLLLGLLMVAGIALCGQFLSPFDLIGAMGSGVMGMAELIIVTLLAGGLMELVRFNGGIDFIVGRMLSHVRSKRMAEFCIGMLVFLTNLCTANNTIAILTVGPIAKEIADRCDVDPRRSASLLDTFSCLAQSIIPYGAQLLIASGLALMNPIDIIPYLYYPFVMAFFVLGAIALQPRDKLDKSTPPPYNLKP